MTVGIGTVKVGGNAAGVCVSPGKDEEGVVSKGVAPAIPAGKEETVCEGGVIPISVEGCVLSAFSGVQALKEKPARANKSIAITTRINFCLPMGLWVETVYE